MEHSVSPSFRCIEYLGKRFDYLDTFPERRLMSMLSRISFSESGCWIWEGGTNKQGYGVVHFDDKKQLVHRLAWMAFVGPLKLRPNQRSLDYDSLHHKCETKSCINPAHLEKISFRQHGKITSTGPAAENRRKTHCKRGHPLSGTNVRRFTNKKTGLTTRHCKTCETNLAKARFKNTYVPHPRPPRTHCANGHELTPENTYHFKGQRQCRVCHKIHSRTYIQRKREKLSTPLPNST